VRYTDCDFCCCCDSGGVVWPQLQRWNPAVSKQQQQRALAEAVAAREAAEAKLLTAEQRATELATELAAVQQQLAVAATPTAAAHSAADHGECLAFTLLSVNVRRSC
jgi:hypothetical protein